MYGIDKTNQLLVDLEDFLEYLSKKELSVEHFISGFHTRVGNISQLNLEEKLNGHILLRQAEIAFRTLSNNDLPRVIIDNRSCSVVVGKGALDKAMKQLNLEKEEDTRICRNNHRFCNYDDDNKSLFGVNIPFA